jgi:hypothetical protein
MIKPMTMLCAVATTVAVYTSPAGAAPLSTPLAFKSVDTQSVEAVRYHRRHHGRAYYGSGYNSYAFAPGYAGVMVAFDGVATPVRAMRRI